MDQSLDQMPAGGAPTPSLFKNPLVIISLIVFILALAFAGYGWWLKSNNLVPGGESTVPATPDQKIDLLKSLQIQATSTASSAETSKLLKELQTTQKSGPALSNEDKMKLLKSLQQQ